MANVLSSLRKLGVNLVGDDGILTNAAMVKLGVGPLKQMELNNEAIKNAQTQAKTVSDLANDASNREYNGAYKRQMIDASNDRMTSAAAARDKLARTEADARQAAADQDAAEGRLAAQSGLDLPSYRAKLRQDAIIKKNYADQGMEPIDEDTAAAYKVKRNADGFASSKAIKLAEDRAKAADALNRTTVTVNSSEGKGERAYIQSHLKAFRAATADDEKAVNAAETARTALNGYKDKPLGNAARENIAIMLFQKGLDPTSVVRNEEYDRLGVGAPMIDRIKNAFLRLKMGGTVPPSTVNDALYGLEIMAKVAKERQRRTAESFMQDSVTAGVPISLDKFLTPSSFAGSEAPQGNKTPTTRKKTPAEVAEEIG